MRATALSGSAGPKFMQVARRELKCFNRSFDFRQTAIDQTILRAVPPENKVCFTKFG